MYLKQYSVLKFFVTIAQCIDYAFSILILDITNIYYFNAFVYLFCPACDISLNIENNARQIENF